MTNGTFHFRAAPHLHCNIRNGLKIPLYLEKAGFQTTLFRKNPLWSLGANAPNSRYSQADTPPFRASL
jgi:hypothetical protein